MELLHPIGCSGKEYPNGIFLRKKCTSATHIDYLGKYIIIIYFNKKDEKDSLQGTSLGMHENCWKCYSKYVAIILSKQFQ